MTKSNVAAQEKEFYELGKRMFDRSKTEALIADLRMNHEYCPKEVILQAADELEKAIAQPAQQQGAA